MLTDIFQLARLIIACGAGLFFPGYFLARILRSRTPALLAFPLSLVILFHCVFVVGLLGCRITFGHVLILIVFADALLMWGSYRASGNRKEILKIAPNWRSAGFFLAAISFLLLIQQCLLTPLSGYDTIFRWDYLARRLLDLHRFNFYPPISAADFKIYYWPDGFPPIVSFSYWWVYAAYGKYVPQLSALVVIPQYLVVLGLTFSLTRQIAGEKFGNAAAALAIALLATSSAYFRDQAIGQESGLMAVSLLAMLGVLLAEPVNLRTMILAAACAALGAMCREYGWAYVLFGVILIAAKNRSAKLTITFLLAAFLFAGPWYVRNFILTGNPFYSLELLHLPVNGVFWSMMQSFPPHYGVMAWTAHNWRDTIIYLLAGSPLQMTIGIAAMFVLLRRNCWLVAAVILSFALWLYSARYTNAGTQYSSRTLAPAWALLSICAAVIIFRWPNPSRTLMRMALVACFALAIISDWIFPFSFFNPPGGSWLAVGLQPHPRHDAVESIVPQMQRVLPPGSRILGDELVGYVLLRDAGYQLVPPWSPEVAFLFDPAVSAEQATARLRTLHITTVLAAPAGSNTFFFIEHSRFYQNADKWKKIGSAPGALLFSLPEKP